MENDVLGSFAWFGTIYAVSLVFLIGSRENLNSLRGRRNHGKYRSFEPERKDAYVQHEAWCEEDKRAILERRVIVNLRAA